jgi:parallel beta-helix repeat protein
MRTASIVTVLLVLAAPAAADTLKVPQDFATIGDAVAAAADGDTISVSKGTYLETVSVTVPNLKLVGKNATIDAQFAGTCLNIEASGVSVSGFTLANGTNGIFASGDNISISKCKVYTCQAAGISAEGAPVTISGNTVAGCGGDGISYLHSLPGDSLIEKNTCQLNQGDGIEVTGDATTISKNKCEQNEGHGINVFVDSLSLEGLPVDQPVLIEKSTCEGNGSNGARVLNGTLSLVTIDKNSFSSNAGDGLFCDAVNVVISKNTCDDNLGDGLNLAVSGTQIEKNSASGNQDDGISIGSALDLGDGGGFGTGNDNSAASNTCKGNRGDGIVLSVGNDNTLSKNKCTGNLDDGIDLNFAGSNNTAILDNTCSDNGHEGLDNTGQQTAIEGNVCKNNGRGIGPDIAGIGDGGAGSVATFENNKFGTGGETTASRLDNYSATRP